jgi:ribosomal-protein-alanine N-acetyltransferase
MTDAKNIIKIAKISGLDDVESWVTAEKAQVLIDHQFWIVFIANNPSQEIRKRQDDTPADLSEAIGIIAGGLEEEGRIWIELMGVSSAFRKTHIGTQLIHKLEHFAKEKGFRALFVDVDADNLIARRFYRKLGFKRAGKIKKYYYDSSATLVYSKTI